MIVSGRGEYEPGTADANAEAGRAKTGYGDRTVERLDGELRARTPRVGLWVDSSEPTVGETGDAILAGRERAGVRRRLVGWTGGAVFGRGRIRARPARCQWWRVVFWAVGRPPSPVGWSIGCVPPGAVSEHMRGSP